MKEMVGVNLKINATDFDMVEVYTTGLYTKSPLLWAIVNSDLIPPEFGDRLRDGEEISCKLVEI